MLTSELRCLRRDRRRRGTSIVEMTIILPLLLMLVFGIGEFGLMYIQWQSLTNATREGARIGVVFRTPCNAATVTSLVHTTVDTYAAEVTVSDGVNASIDTVEFRKPRPIHCESD